MIKVISFSVDGAFVDKSSFEDLFWYEEIPAIYSREFKVSQEKAKAAVQSAYKEISLFDPEWHKPETWFKRLKLDPDEDKLLKDLKGNYMEHRDVRPAIEHLYSTHRYKLVAITNSSKSYLRYKLKTLDMQGFFSKIVSAVDDFDKVKKDAGVFQDIFTSFGVTPDEVMHVGDDLYMDFDVPSTMRVHSYLLDRRMKKSGTHVVHDMTEFLQKVKEIDARFVKM